MYVCTYVFTMQMKKYAKHASFNAYDITEFCYRLRMQWCFKSKVRKLDQVVIYILVLPQIPMYSFKLDIPKNSKNYAIVFCFGYKIPEWKIIVALVVSSDSIFWSQILTKNYETFFATTFFCHFVKWNNSVSACKP